MTTTPYLEPITTTDFKAAIALKVRPDQERPVVPVESLAEAYVQPDVA